MVTNNIKWVAHTIAPNPMEIDYWIDLTSDPNGSIIKYYKDDKWVDLLSDSEQETDIEEIRSQITELKDSIDSIKVVKDSNDYNITVDNNIIGTITIPDYDDTNTTYTFANGTNGSFTVTPSNGTVQTVTIGKPSTAGTADVANSVTWANVSGKPSTYTPSTHTHTVSQITDFPELSTVATSGSYNDLTDKPTIPSYTNATTTTAGLMSGTDKQNLDNLVSNTAGYQTESEVDAKVSALVNSAPETLDTLDELAAALGDDPNFATTVANQIGTKADKTVVSTSTNGLMSSTDKQKLDSIEENANHYVLSTATNSVLGGVKSSTTGTTSGRDYNVQVNSDGTMKVNVPWTNTTYNVATTAADGLMSSEDKTKLDSLDDVNVANLDVFTGILTQEDPEQEYISVTFSRNNTITGSNVSDVIGSTIYAANSLRMGYMTSDMYNKLNSIPNIQVVASLPESPVTNTIYFVTGE